MTLNTENGLQPLQSCIWPAGAHDFMRFHLGVEQHGKAGIRFPNGNLGFNSWVLPATRNMPCQLWASASSPVKYKCTRSCPVPASRGCDKDQEGITHVDVGCKTLYWGYSKCDPWIITWELVRSAGFQASIQPCRTESDFYHPPQAMCAGALRYANPTVLQFAA